MNLDFHVHGILSKNFLFDPNLLLEEVKTAKENGLNGFIMCEHFNAIDFNCIHEYLKNNFTYTGNCYLIDNFSIFPGIEIAIKNKGHIILSGDRDNILVIRKLLEPHFSKDNRIDLKALLDLADKFNCLKIGAHPFRRGHKLYTHPIDQLKRLDALDLNAKDIYINGIKLTLDELNPLSAQLNVNIITGSDSHFPSQLGCIMTNLNSSCYTVDDIRQLINSQQYSIDINDHLIPMVKSAKISKRYITKLLSK